ncbi:MAG: anthranilate synthase component I [Euryarchaeota archaeon]|nr:anthranilate synthase component I [Euryarchaeota archaeon]
MPELVPLVRRLPAANLSPAGVYSVLRERKPAFLLESAIVGEKIARYSFIGCEPAEVIALKDGRLRMLRSGREERAENPLAPLRRYLKLRVSAQEKLPRFFGGLVGFLAYDAVRYFEDIGSSTEDDLQHEDALFMLAKDVVAFDHWREEVLLISSVIAEEGEVEQVKGEAEQRLNMLERLLKRAEGRRPEARTSGGEPEPSSNFSREEFMRAVERAKEYIYAGEIFQVVLSQRFEVPFSGDPFEVYLALKEINPSPYMYCLELEDKAIVGSSPEILVRVEGRKVVTRPIAGTRPRGKDVVEDEALARDMLNDEKERAEHVMLVDLGRNDIGKVARFGSVTVDEFMSIERYSHVQHSNVVGELREDKDAFDALEACFPAGTVSGAPKVRAMQIIEELEPTRRGIYAGAVGYFSFSGDMDFAIAIRTIVFQKGRAYVQAGAGIVADSVPEREYEETRNKGRGMLRAIAVGGG